MIVMKFGGTSVESAEAISRVCGIVAEAERECPIVVVSAMGKTTNQLLICARESAGGRRDQALAIADILRQDHLRHALAVAGRFAAEIERHIRAHFDWLDELIKGLSIVRELSPRSLDTIASLGERLSSMVVQTALQARGVRAQHLDARRVIVTDDRFTQAQPLWSETYARLQEELRPMAESGVVVMGGYIGATLDGQTTTLGRGGSDYSAAIVGAGVGASEIQIWTDVDGMLTADPRVVPEALRIKQLSFAEAAEMAYFGAKVLHPATVLPAVEKNIPVSIRNSRRPGQGTRITSEAVRCGNAVKSISCKRGITAVNIQSTRMLMAHGFLHRIFTIFDRHRTSVDMVSTSEVSVSLTVDDQTHLSVITAELSEFADVTQESGQAIVCLVGENIRHTSGIAGRAFGVLSRVNVRMISQGASLLNIGLVVTEEDMPEAVRALHAEFFDAPDEQVFDPVFTAAAQ